MNQSEAILQQTLVAMLRTLYPGLVINLSLNGISLNGLSPKQKAQIIAQCKKEGMENGIQDLSLYLPNSVILNLELKTSTGKQSPDQLAIQEKLNQLGHNYHVIRDVYKVLKLIGEHTTLSYRIEQYYALPIHSDQQLLTEQFLHFPPGTELSDVKKQIKSLYHI